MTNSIKVMFNNLLISKTAIYRTHACGSQFKTRIQLQFEKEGKSSRPQIQERCGDE